jgi:predicted DNA-binding protein (UPF0251 family)
MVRPRKPRRIGYQPEEDSYNPSKEDYIELGYEELEAIRLMDYQDLTQQEAADLMAVGRTTLQSIYKSARAKVARALVENISISYVDNECYKFYSSDDPCCRKRRRKGRCEKRKNCPDRENCPEE